MTAPTNSSGSPELVNRMQGTLTDLCEQALQKQYGASDDDPQFRVNTQAFGLKCTRLSTEISAAGDRRYLADANTVSAAFSSDGSARGTFVVPPPPVGVDSMDISITSWEVKPYVEAHRFCGVLGVGYTHTRCELAAECIVFRHSSKVSRRCIWPGFCRGEHGLASSLIQLNNHRENCD